MKRNWYVKCDSAEEDAYYLISLTDEEAKAVVRFTDKAELIFGGGYCGSSYLLNPGHPFKTKEDALEWLDKYERSECTEEDLEYIDFYK